MTHPLLEKFRDFAQGAGIAGDAYIVGGAVRDVLIGKELKDIDIAAPGDALKTAERFAHETGGTFVLLDRHFGTARVVKDGEFLDISSLRNGSIQSDLSARDITINAMAIPLTSGSAMTDLIDPYGGKNDLSRGVIRMVSEAGLVQDPLRILRVYRFAAALNFSIDAYTLDAVRRLRPLMQSVAVERIAGELRLLLALHDSFRTVAAMAEDGVLPDIVPEACPNLREHALRRYKKVEEVLDDLPGYFGSYAEPVSGYFGSAPRRFCLKLSALLPGPGAAEKAASRLKLSVREAVFLHKVAANRRAIPDRYRGSGSPDRKSAVDLMKKSRDDIYPILVASIAESSVLSQEDSIVPVCREALLFYHEEFKPRAALLPVITGDDLIREFRLPPSPLFKGILSAVEDMVLEGKIHSRDEALDAVRELLKK